MQLESKVAVITGASGGIGREIAMTFAEQGADVVVAARSEDTLEETRALVEERGRTGLVVPTDVTDPSQVDALVEQALERFDHVDVLVNNSGVEGPTKALWEIEPDEWRSTLDVNLTGVFLCCRGFLPHMVERGEGSVVVIGSILGKHAVFGRTPYAATKLGLVGVVRGLATEAGEHNVRVNLISPGAVEGERLNRVIQAQADAAGESFEDTRERLAGQSPLDRLTSPRDVASAAVFLASPAAASITGEDLNVTAGLVMH